MDSSWRKDTKEVTGEGRIIGRETTQPLSHLPHHDKPSQVAGHRGAWGLTQTPEDPHLHTAGSADSSGRKAEETGSARRALLAQPRCQAFCSTPGHFSAALWFYPHILLLFLLSCTPTVLLPLMALSGEKPGLELNVPDPSLRERYGSQRSLS